MDLEKSTLLNMAAIMLSSKDSFINASNESKIDEVHRLYHLLKNVDLEQIPKENVSLWDVL